MNKDILGAIFFMLLIVLCINLQDITDYGYKTKVETEQPIMETKEETKQGVEYNPISEAVIEAEEMYAVDKELILAIIETESNFNAYAVSESSDYGLMQLNESNHGNLEKIFKTNSFFDVRTNIVMGTYMLRCIMNNNYTLEQTLMVYHYGGDKAQTLWDKGIYKSDYTDKVIRIYERNLKNADIRATETS